MVECDSAGMGTFTAIGMNDELQVTEGLLMTSGTVFGAMGPNNSSSYTGSNIQGIQGDPDLEILIPGFGVNDVCRVEFDLVPNFDNLLFDFVFGSDEYLEYVNSNFNGVFAFFVSGPGINGPYSNGADNFSLIPGTDMPVTIDNVNDIVNSGFYMGNGDGILSPYSTSDLYVQYDGLTTNIEGTVPVIAGETYHVKIAVADVGDTALDSGVFIQKDSFRSAAPLGVDEISHYDIELYPNPTSDFLMLAGKDMFKVDYCEILSLEGKVISTHSVDSDGSKVDVQTMDAGFYTFRLVGQGVVLSTFSWVKK